MDLEGQSSLNSALASATEAAESKQAEDEGKRASQEAEEVADEQKPSHSNKIEMEGGESHSVNGSIEQDRLGGIEGGLQSQSSIMDSNSLGNIPEGDATATYLGSELFETSELEVIEAALTTLQSVEGQIDAPEAGEQRSLSSNAQQDSQSVVRLLQKVQAVKARKTSLQLPKPSVGSSRQGPPEEGDMEPAGIRQVVQAAAEAALAAAKTAETVVSSLNRNSQAMEALCKALTSGESLHLPVGDTALEGEKDEECSESSDNSNETKFLAIELQQTEIAKNLVRQNRVTHWVLGFIVVSSLIWRYGVVKVFKKVNNTIQNPFQGIQDKFFPRADEEDPESERNELSLPQLKIPGILGGEEEPEQQKRLPRQEKESNPFDLGKIFPSDKPETGREVKKHVKQPKPKGKFHLGNFLPKFK